MIDWEQNPYYNPQNVGAEIVAVLEDNEPYEFDMIVVLREVETKKLYIQHDAGCSCPTPFEDYPFPDKWVELTSIEQVDELIKEEGYTSWDNRFTWSESRIFDFRKKIMTASEL